MSFLYNWCDLMSQKTSPIPETGFILHVYGLMCYIIIVPKIKSFNHLLLGSAPLKHHKVETEP